MSSFETRPDRQATGIRTGEVRLPDLSSATLELIRQVPAGNIGTYGAIARALGDPVAARWVGKFLLDHPHDDSCPCYRIVRADGQLGRYLVSGGERKRMLLMREGCLLPSGRADLGRRWTGYHSSFPLRQLAEWQTRIAAAAEVEAPDRARLVGGVDVSYDPNGCGVAAMAIVDRSTRQLQWSITCRQPVDFPYISSYLAFRELPLLLELVQRVRDENRMPDVILVDGSGRLHPRGCGIATMLGVLTGHVTIGLTKKLLCGAYRQPLLSQTGVAPVQLDGATVGAALLPKSGSRKPLFVSPGHRTDINTAITIVQQLLQARRLPAPIYWADRISREAARENPTC